MKLKKLDLKYLLIILVVNLQIVLGQKDSSQKIRYFTKKGIYSLTIEILDLESNEGNIMLGLFDENKNQIVGVKKIPISKKKSFVKIDSIASGNYVVKFWHDTNNNEKLDINFLGIPKEEFGNSNNVKPKFGPPKFEDMIFKIEDNFYLKMIAQSLNL
jgi:uncharacterized protein (DUF2141 family)